MKWMISSLIFLTVLIVLSSCRKKEPPCEPLVNFVPFPEEFASYFPDAEVGDQWLYHDTVVNKWDTLTLVTLQDNNQHPGGRVPIDTEGWDCPESVTLRGGYVYIFWSSNSKREIRLFGIARTHSVYFHYDNNSKIGCGSGFWEFENGTWTFGSTIPNYTYKYGAYDEVIENVGNSCVTRTMRLAKNDGIVFYQNIRISVTEDGGGTYHLVQKL